MKSKLDDDDFGLEQQAFEQLEKEFQDVLNELKTDPALEAFRLEYEKLNRTLKISHENEVKLLFKCKELNNEIISNAAQVQTALKLTQEDSQTINILKTELDKTYKLLELTQEREQKSKEKMQGLDQQIKHLNNLIEQGNTLSSGQSNTVHELLIVKDELIKEKDMLSAMIAHVNIEKESNDDYVKQLGEEKEKIVQDQSVIKQKIEEMEKQTISEEERKKQIQDELEAVKKNYDNSRKDFNKAQEELQQLISDYQKLNEQFVSSRQERDYLEKKKKELERFNTQTNERLQEQREINEMIEKQIIEMKQSLETLEEQRNYQNQKNEFLTMQIERLQDDLNNIIQNKEEAEKLNEIVKSSINELEREAVNSKKMTMDATTMIEELKRARDILLKEVNRIDNNNKKQEEELKFKEKYEKEKQNEYEGLNKEMEKKKKKITLLEKEKEKYGIQAAQANAKFFHSLEEIKLKDNLISEFQKKNIESEAKLKQQQNLYEAVRSDRNIYCKKLAEEKKNFHEFKQKYNTVNHKISQYKEEIESKEKQLTTEHLDSKRKDKKIEEQHIQLEKFQKEIGDKEEKINEFKKGINKLHYIIDESDVQKKKLKEEHDLVVAERDILGTQLIRRNEEAQLLYEKIKINQSYLKKGKAQYGDRIGDIQKLKNEIASVMTEIKNFKITASQLDDLNNDKYNLERELIEEQLKVKALSEEIENPINIHRWRKLEATDSETFELMTKIHTLQKRLISKNSEVQQKEQLIQNKEKTLKELRDIMKRQPGNEEAKMINVYNDSLKQKTQQMQAMNTELEMYQEQLKEYKFEQDRLNSELQDTKKAFYALKQRELYEQENIQAKPLAIQVNLPEKRFAGGGFNLVT